MRRLFLLSLIALGCSSKSETTKAPVPTEDAAACTFTGAPETPLPIPKIHTPRWAFRPWISKDISTSADTYAFVKGFEERDIPVGVVVLDSPWETNYNTFVPNPSRYPGFPKLVTDLKAKDIRLVLWVTQLVNEKSFDLEPGGDKYELESPNYAEGKACGFFINEGEGFAWWKGTGASVDFWNARARTWWHAQQKTLLDMGVAGWKLDFGDSYVDKPVVRTAEGEKTHQQYSEKYYEDFWSYGVSVRGPEEFVTMVRPWDESYSFKGRFHARPEHAPVTWVGDNKRDFVGLVDALDHSFRSMQAGYVVIGSDIGGYLDFDDVTLQRIPADTLVFARWTAVSALMPFFQLHGRANLTPWTVEDHVDETVAMYRYWSKLHEAMVPFFYSLAEEAYAAGTKKSIMKPVGDTVASWAKDFRFTVGDAFLVAPILDASGKRDVALPAGARWIDWFQPKSDAIAGGTTITGYDATDRKVMPLFLREGAIVPLDVVDDANGLGSKKSKGARTVLVVPGQPGKFVAHDEEGGTTTYELASKSLKISRATRPLLLRIRADGGALIKVNGVEVPVTTKASFEDMTTACTYVDAETRSIWVRVPVSTSAITIEGIP